MKLKREEAGVYVTEDGRYEVQKSWAVSECDNPHPVKISRELRNQARYTDDPQPKNVSDDMWFAAKLGKRGYMCDGGAEHWYVSWGVWDRKGDDYVDGGNHFDTKRDAVAFLTRHLAPTHTPSHKLGRPDHPWQDQSLV